MARRRSSRAVAWVLLVLGVAAAITNSMGVLGLGAQDLNWMTLAAGFLYAAFGIATAALILRRSDRWRFTYLAWGATIALAVASVLEEIPPQTMFAFVVGAVGCVALMSLGWWLVERDLQS